MCTIHILNYQQNPTKFCKSLVGSRGFASSGSPPVVWSGGWSPWLGLGRVGSVRVISYFLPPRLVVLVGPNKSKCNSSRSLDVDTTFFDLKDFLDCFPNWHALQILSYLKLICGIPTIKLFLIKFSIK